MYKWPWHSSRPAITTWSARISFQELFITTVAPSSTMKFPSSNVNFRSPFTWRNSWPSEMKLIPELGVGDWLFSRWRALCTKPKFSTSASVSISRSRCDFAERMVSGQGKLQLIAGLYSYIRFLAHVFLQVVWPILSECLRLTFLLVLGYRDPDCLAWPHRCGSGLCNNARHHLDDFSLRQRRAACRTINHSVPSRVRSPGLASESGTRASRAVQGEHPNIL